MSYLIIRYKKRREIMTSYLIIEVNGLVKQMQHNGEQTVFGMKQIGFLFGNRHSGHRVPNLFEPFSLGKLPDLRGSKHAGEVQQCSATLKAGGPDSSALCFSRVLSCRNNVSHHLVND